METRDLATRPAPTTYAEAEKILQKLSRTEADSLWSALTEEGAKAILRSLAPALPEPDPSPTPENRASELPVRVPETSPPMESADEEPEASRGPVSIPHLSEKLLLNVLEMAPDAIAAIDRRGLIVLVNEQTEKMFGYQRSELLGKKIEILVPVRKRVMHVQQRREFFQEPKNRPMGTGRALFGLRKDGMEFPVDIRLSHLETEVGTLAISIIRDITERKRHEAELRKAEARYRSLVEGIPAVTFFAPFDEEVGELYVSPQIEKLLGFTKEEWLNDPVLWHRQLHPEDRERWHLDFARTCASARPFRSEYRFLARDGREVWVQGEAMVVRDRDGRPQFLQGVAFDITERKKAEDAKALKQSNEKLAQFSFRVAHELKHSVSAINNVLNGPISKDEPSDPLEKRLGEIKLVVHDAAELIRGILEHAMVKQEAKIFAPMDCAALAREVRKQLQTNIKACKGTVTLESLPVVLGHRESLKSVFRNLISNAIKYRTRRRLKVRVSAELVDGSWRFRVRDNGMGIEKHNKYTPNINNWEKIFDLFERETKKGPFGEIAGHGIGLSYCRKVIEHHGGKMEVEESEPGKGSTFYFTLPAIVDAASLGPK
jgi:PAS domain S-box-containing protein